VFGVSVRRLGHLSGELQRGRQRQSRHAIDDETASDEDVRGEVFVFLISVSWRPITKKRSAARRAPVEDLGPRGLPFRVLRDPDVKPLRKYRLRVLRSDEGKEAARIQSPPV
jgi:hypothetical protein